MSSGQSAGVTGLKKSVGYGTIGAANARLPDLSNVWEAAGAAARAQVENMLPVLDNEPPRGKPTRREQMILDSWAACLRSAIRQQMTAEATLATARQIVEDVDASEISTASALRQLKQIIPVNLSYEPF